MRFTVVILIILFNKASFAQSIRVDHMMERRLIDCKDVLYNVNYLIPEYYQKNQIDTLYALVKYWENSCGLMEESFRLKVLLAIKQNKFEELKLDSEIFKYLIAFKDSSMAYMQTDLNMIGIFERNEIRALIPDLNLFMKQLAKELLDHKILSVEEKFFVTLYAHQSHYFNQLEEKKFDDSRLQDVFLREKYPDNYRTIFQHQLAIGAWIPQDSLAKIGNKFLLAYRLGFKHKRFQSDFNMEFKFGNVSNPIRVLEEDSIWLSNQVSSFYFGLDMGVDLFKSKKADFSLISGVGLENMAVLRYMINEGEDDEETVVVNRTSFNYNIGLRYKAHLNYRSSFVMESRYHFLDINNHGGTNLNGNALVFSCGINFKFIKRGLNL